MKAVLLLLLLGFSPRLVADCSWAPRQSMEFRTTALDVSADGEFVWVATGYGVQLLEGMRIVDSVALPGLTRAVRATSNGFAYAGSGSRVHALRREGRNIIHGGSAEASGSINAFAIASSYLFAATSNGIDHYDLLNPAAPVKTSIVLRTSSPNVTSLATSRNLLYAADGDTSVETFTIATPSLPQDIGTIEATFRASAVHFVDDLLYVSDRLGQNTEVFSGMSRVARLPVGANSLAPIGGRIHLVAGSSRTIRAVDFASVDRIVEYLELQLAPTGGTDNVIHAMARVGNTVYVAGGDMGVAAIDVSAIAKPFPLVNYATGAMSSVRTVGNKVYVADFGATLFEYRLDPNGLSLVEERKWTAPAGSTIRDLRDNGLLTSAERDLTLWALVSTTPTAVLTAKFVTDVAAAVSADGYMIALLANGSVYTVRTAQPVPQKVTLPPMSLLTRAGSAVIMAEVRESDARTVLHYWANGDLATEARRFTVDGAAVGTIALDATRAAIFTFNGISVIDLATGNVRVIAGSNSLIPRQLAFAGDDLVALDGRRLHVFENARTFVRAQPLPGDTVAFDLVGTVTVLASYDGVGAVSRTRPLPEAVTPFTNSYYTKVVAAADRVYLFEKNGIDVFSTTGTSMLRYVTGINARGVVDLAASDAGLHTVSGNGTVAAWSRAGALVAQKTLSEGPGAQPLAIAAVRGAVWVAMSTGCGTGACERKTLVLDPSTLAVTATLPGALRDVVVSGNRAYALFDAPDELRVLDVGSPLQPAQVNAAARPASAMSLAYENGRIYVLGERLYTFSEATLAAAGERFTAMPAEASQRIRVEDGCVIVTGRADNPELFGAPAFTPVTASAVPSSVRSLAALPGRLLFLTGHSLEVWSKLPQPATPSKRRSAR